MRQWVPLLLAASTGCATHETVLHEVSRSGVQIAEAEQTRQVLRARTRLPEPDRPALAVEAIVETHSRRVRVRRYTPVVRVRRVTARLSAGGHFLVWTAGWIAGGPIVWYPILAGRARREAQYHAEHGDAFHGSLHPWVIDIREFERDGEPKEDVLREITPLRVTDTRPAAGAGVVVRLRPEAGDVVLDELGAQADERGLAEFDLSAVVGAHVLDRGLEPLAAEVAVTDGERHAKDRVVLREAELVAAYQGSDVDWSAGPANGEVSLGADVYLDRTAYGRGRVPRVDVSLVNNGSGTAFRVWARVTSPAFPDRARPLFFGRIEPGRVVDGSIHLWPLPRAGRLEVKVEILSEGKVLLERTVTAEVHD